ncbi:MAG: sulfotransferase [Phycisphaerales bacterium]|nr:sulfotransferase [Phycisphaerales bacterium]
MPKRPPKHAASPSDLRLNALGEAALQALGAGQPERAEALADQALAIAPGLAPALAARASARVRLRRYDEAESDIRAALRTQPSPPPQWTVTLALIHRGRGELDAALDLLLDCHSRHPAAQIVTSNLAELLVTTRRPDAAHQVLAEALARGADRPGLIAQYGRVCRLLGRPGEAVASLREASQRTDQPPSGRQQVLFELGHVLDSLGEFDHAFDAFTQANALERRTFDMDRHAALVDRILEEWTREALERTPRADPVLGSRSVLIVGMRRSGTTLIEQILGAHPQCQAGGELSWLRDLATPLDPESARPFGLVVDRSRLTAAEVERLGRGYAALSERVRGSAEFLTDKMPANHKLLGVVSLALQGVRVVWCRRHPLDTCLSCFMQGFNDNSYCADLPTLARYLHDCERLTAHWCSTLDLPILPLHYERLVADPEGETRRLLEFVGMPFDEACLRFHEASGAARTASTDQVAQRLYNSSVGRAGHYRSHLEPLIREFDRLGVAH